MKLDTTGLESFPKLVAPGNDVVGEFTAPPSFELPNSNDVSNSLFASISRFWKCSCAKIRAKNWG